MNPPEICIIGDNCVDLYPVQEKKYAGGNAVNTAVAVKRNGIECGYLGIVGNDEDGKLIIDALQKISQRLSKTETKRRKHRLDQSPVGRGRQDLHRRFAGGSKRMGSGRTGLRVPGQIQLGPPHHLFQLESGRKKQDPGL